MQAITNTYGSDKLPCLSFGGVMIHEICLSVMITSIKHPLVFVTLVLADVFENAFCLWSLSRSKASRSTVVPIEEDDASTHTKSTHEKKSLTKRSSSVFSLAKDLRDVKDESSEGTALFIAAILLQREMCETIVPIQAAFVMSVLYASDVKSNSMVSQWTSRDDYIQAVTYLGIDLGVELVVFVELFCILDFSSIKWCAADESIRSFLRTFRILNLCIKICVWIFLCFQKSLKTFYLCFCNSIVASRAGVGASLYLASEFSSFFLQQQVRLQYSPIHSLPGEDPQQLEVPEPYLVPWLEDESPWPEEPRWTGSSSTDLVPDLFERSVGWDCSSVVVVWFESSSDTRELVSE